MPINVLRFEERYNQGRVEHWVTYAPKHAPMAETSDKVSRLRPPEEFDSRHRGGIKEQHMTAIWSVLGPAYEAWLKGQEIPEDGIPLASWAGVNEAQVRELRKHQIRTVEDLAGMTDGQSQKVQLPAMPQLRRHAQEFLAGKGQTDMARKVTEQEAEMEALREQLAEMRAIMTQDAKPKRGRPKKSESEAA